MKEAESTVFDHCPTDHSSFIAYALRQSLSKYRTFSLGTSLANLSKEIDEGPIDATNQNMNEKSRHSVAS